MKICFRNTGSWKNTMKKYNVTGMTCAACSARVEKAVKRIPGVEECAVNLLSGSMSVKGNISEKDIILAVEKAGYGCSLQNGGEKKDGTKDTKKETNIYKEESEKLIHRLISSVIFLIILMYFSMGHNMLGFPLPLFFHGNPAATGIVQLLCCIAVMFINRKFFVSGIRSVIRLSPNMDALVSIGSGASFLYSCAGLFLITDSMAKGDITKAQHLLHGLYFESAAMILALITVGKALEARSKAKTGDALKSLEKLVPETATVLKDGKEVTVKISEIAVGDIFTVRPGGQIPVDGFIVSGNTAVNESAITGESVPAEKKEGDTVIGATLNTSGCITCRATRVGNDTALSKIINTVTDAFATKAPIAKTADKVAAVFVPAVMLIAVLTAIIWLILGKDAGFALSRAVSVLVISCPCSLGLATPVAIMVGSGVGAKHGILFKNASALEMCGRIDTVVLDKTGTVTTGDINVTGIYPAAGIEVGELLSSAYTLEEKSEHPLSGAICRYCRENRVEILPSDSFSASVGSGVTCNINGRAYFGGKAEYLSGNGIEIPQKELSKAQEISKKGSTPLYFAAKDKYLGIISVSDTIKTDSRSAVEQLYKMGLEPVLLSGDNKLVTNSVAEKAGIGTVFSEATPQSKSETVRSLCKKGKVAMVGDGINDAPALALADVGIAIGTGTDIARDTAEIILTGSNLTTLVNAVKLSRSVLRNIRQNLFWAFFYNCIGIPVAAGVLTPLGITLSPMTGALAMGLSSFCVVSNALRLNAFRAEKSETDDKTEKNTEVEICIDPEIPENKERNENRMEKKFRVEGMMCHHCENHVKKALEKIDGVESATAVHTEGKVTVILSKAVDDSVLKAAITEEGYEVTG